MGSSRLIAIGDVHGCFHALDAVLNAIEPSPGDRIVFLGDMVDSGKESREVLERIIALKQECDVVLIQGNHEEMMYAARESEKALRYWENCGGIATVNSYRFGGTFADIPAEHWRLLDTCLPYYETEDFILTHANYVPDLPMAEQPEYSLRWELFDHEKVQPHVSGKTVVVGHTEQKNAEILDLGYAICIDTVCCKYGWLTAIDMNTRQTWQANRWGLMRDPNESSPRHQLKELLKPIAVA